MKTSLLYATVCSVILTGTNAEPVSVPMHSKSNSLLRMNYMKLVKGLTDPLSGGGDSSSSTDKRELSQVALHNEKVGFYANVQVGDSKKPVEALIDTGSSDIWVAKKSVPNYQLKQKIGNFKASYGPDQVQVEGDFVKDQVKFGEYKVNDQQFAIVNDNSNESPADGVFGLAPQGSQNVQVKYPTFSQTLKKQGLIKRDAFALYLSNLNESTGYIVFGGFDRKKFTGSLAVIPMSNESWFRVPGEMLNVSGTFHADLDTGSAMNYLPKKMLDEIAKVTGAEYDKKAGAYFYKEMPESPIEFQIGGASISVPPGEYIVMSEGKYMLAMLPTKKGPNILGLPLLRSTYTLIDNDSKTISLAQSSFSDKSNIKELSSVDN